MYLLIYLTTIRTFFWQIYVIIYCINCRISIRQDSTSEGVLAEMQILGTESTDAGAYFCQASNLYGKEQQLVNLHVQGKYFNLFHMIILMYFFR